VASVIVVLVPQVLCLENLKNVIHGQRKVNIEVGSLLRRKETEPLQSQRGPSRGLPVNWLGLGILTVLLLGIGHCL
jgi:hypothetical protein